jgi:hypothetical protein
MTMLFLVFHNSIPETDDSVPYKQRIALSVGLRPHLAWCLNTHVT